MKNETDEFKKSALFDKYMAANGLQETKHDPLARCSDVRREIITGLLLTHEGHKLEIDAK